MKRLCTLTDQQLLAASSSDQAAFVEFYERHESGLLLYLARATRNSEVAADLTAEVFAVLIAALIDGQTITEPRGWLFAVAKRKLIDSARRGKVEMTARARIGMEPTVLTDAGIERIDELGDDDSDRAKMALAELPEEQRTAIEARVIGELSYAEAAEHLECSEAVVRKRVSRGLSQLRNRIGGKTS